MATNSNSITLVGNLTRDPELRYTTGGRGVANFGLAVNRRYQVNGEWQEQTSFFNVVAWAELGENVAASLTKGSRAIVFGRLEQREYENREGEKRTMVEVIADEVGPSLRRALRRRLGWFRRCRRREQWRRRCPHARPDLRRRRAVLIPTPDL
jgi:single-strand DNA-binding protein